MKQYFEAQLANGKPVTLEQIEETISDAKDAQFATEEWKAHRRSKVGRVLLFYAIRVIREGKYRLTVEQVWDDKLETLSSDWIFESYTDNDSIPIFHTAVFKEFIDQRFSQLGII